MRTRSRIRTATMSLTVYIRICAAKPRVDQNEPDLHQFLGGSGIALLAYIVGYAAFPHSAFMVTMA
jgi:hypothetical protein